MPSSLIYVVLHCLLHRPRGTFKVQTTIVFVFIPSSGEGCQQGHQIFQKTDPSGKSIVTSISYDFKDEGKIILSCYNMDEATNQIDSPIKDINQFDTFRIDVRSKALAHYLQKA